MSPVFNYKHRNKKILENCLSYNSLNIRNQLLTESPTGNTFSENIYRDPINWPQSSATEGKSKERRLGDPCPGVTQHRDLQEELNVSVSGAVKGSPPS